MESSTSEWQNPPHRCVIVRLGSCLPDFYQALESFDNTPEVRVAIVVSEEGFSAGESEVVTRERYEPRKPLIMALRGLQTGASLGAFLSIGAMRVASTNTSFANADIRSHNPVQGMFPYAVWAGLFMTRRLLTAQTALGCNLINEVVDDQRLEARVFELAARLAEILPRAPVLEKEARALGQFINGDALNDYGFGAYVLSAHHVYPVEETRAVALRRRPKLRRPNSAG